MDSVPFSFSANVVGVVTGALSLFGVFATFYRAHLPDYKLRDLERVLKETENIYESALEANLLPCVEFRERISGTFVELRHEIHAHRLRTYQAPTFRGQYVEFFRGLSFSISRTNRKIRNLCALIITSCEDECAQSFVIGESEAPDEFSPTATTVDRGETEHDEDHTQHTQLEPTAAYQGFTVSETETGTNLFTSAKLSNMNLKKPCSSTLYEDFSCTVEPIDSLMQHLHHLLQLGDNLPLDVYLARQGFVKDGRFFLQIKPDQICKLIPLHDKNVIV